MSCPAQPTWATSPDPDPAGKPQPHVDPATSVQLSTIVGTLIGLADSTSDRSLQTSLGASEIGAECDRQLVYKLNGIPAVNRPDPLRAIIGSGLHLWLAQAIEKVDRGAGRFVVERRVEYRGIKGSADCFDRELHVVIDWKSSTLKKIADFKRQGVPRPYEVQAHTYGAALADRGEDVRNVALVFIPIDGTLLSIWSWVVPFDRTIADAAVDRVDTLRGRDPATVTACPSRLCGWCPAYSPNSADLSVACTGRK